MWLIDILSQSNLFSGKPSRLILEKISNLLINSHAELFHITLKQKTDSIEKIRLLTYIYDN